MKEEQAFDSNETELSGKYLTFFLEDEEYGLQILKVQEIIGMMAITPVPRTPEFIRGVINLRGKIIPVIDLRKKFGMRACESRHETCIIVVRTRGVETGLVVDRVSEVADVDGAEVEKSPDFGAQVDTGYLLGIGKTGGKVRLLLDIDKVLSSDEFAVLRATTDDGPRERA